MITTEQFDTIPEDEKKLIIAVFHEIGIDYNRHMADCLALMEEGVEMGLFKISVKTLRNEFVDKWKEVLVKIDEQCESVIINDFYISDTNLEELTCKVIPDLDLVEE